MILVLISEKCDAHEQQDGLYCDLLSCSILEHLPINTIIINNLGDVQHTSFQRNNRPLLMNKQFLGKNIFKAAECFLSDEELKRFNTLITSCIEQGQVGELSNLKYETSYGFPEYFKIKVIPQADKETIVIILMNTTEEVLLEEEFTRVNREFAASNESLSVALSNLDLYVMDRERIHNDLASLHKIITRIKATSGSMEEVLDTSLAAISSELGYTRCAIYLKEEDSSRMVIKAALGLNDSPVRDFISMAEIPPAANVHQLGNPDYRWVDRVV